MRHCRDTNGDGDDGSDKKTGADRPHAGGTPPFCSEDLNGNLAAQVAEIALSFSSAERPRDGFLRPSVEPACGILHRCVVFQAAVASDGSSIHGSLHDANERPLPAGPAPGLPATEATTVASTARANGHRGENVGPNERGRGVGGAVQRSQE